MKPNKAVFIFILCVFTLAVGLIFSKYYSRYIVINPLDLGLNISTSNGAQQGSDSYKGNVFSPENTGETAPAQEVDVNQYLEQNPDLKKVVDSNPDVKKQLEGLKTFQDIQNKINSVCQELNKSPVDFSKIDPKLLTPVFGDNAVNYVKFLTAVKNDCDDGTISLSEMQEIIALIGLLKIDLQKLSL